MKRKKIGVVVNISFDKLTAHPIFCLQLSFHLTQFGEVTLYIPYSGKRISTTELESSLGFAINFKIETVVSHFLRKRSLRVFFLTSVLKLWFHGKNLVWAFEPYSIRFASRFGINSVLEIHSSLPSQRYINVCRKVQDDSRFKLFITNSEAHCQLLRSKGFLGRKLLGAHNAISESLLHDRPKSLDKQRFWSEIGVKESLVVTYAGSLYRGRGVELIIESAPNLPGIGFVVLGGPEEQRKKLESQTRSSNVYFLGAVPHHQVQRYLVASDILVALYTLDCEDIGGNKTILTASPMKLFEYMASGVPVISSNLGAIPEIINNGITGLLIDPESKDEFINAIKTLEDKPELRQKIQKAAFAKASDYTWPKRLRSIFDIIDAE